MLAVLFAATLAGAPPQAEPRPAALTSAEACLREKVRTAVDASTSASDAADFLLTYLCAAPVDRAASYQRNTEMLATMKGMFEGMEAMQAGLEAPEASDDADSEGDPDAGAFPSAFFGGLDGIHVDPVTGDLVVEEGASSVMISALRSQTGALGQLMGDQRPVFLRELAGQLVLETRRRR